MDAADWQVRTTTTFRWRDFNGNHIYDAGESNLNLNGADFLSQSGGSNFVPCNPANAVALGCPQERQPKSDELSLSLEPELGQNFGVRASYVYSRYHDTYRILNTLRPCAMTGRALGGPCPGSYDVPVVQSDPGPDGIRGNADDPLTATGQPVLFTYYEYAAALSGRAFERFVRVNDPAADQKYNSIDIAMSKRLSKNWQLTASYSATKRNLPLLYADITAAASTSAGEFNGNVESGQLTPNNEINAADKDWEYSGKLSGVYQMPWGILTSANYEARSGYPWARQVQFTGGRTVPNMTINVEPNGTRRLPVSNQLDVRFEKTFALTHGQKLAARANIFNILNANTVLEITRLSGPNFNRPTTVMDPRIIEIGFTYSF